MPTRPRYAQTFHERCPPFTLKVTRHTPRAVPLTNKLRLDGLPIFSQGAPGCGVDRHPGVLHVSNRLHIAAT